MLLAVAIIGLVLVEVTHAAARSVSFYDVCVGFMISKRGNDVLIRCPGAPLDQPWMTIKDCKNPVVQRTATTVQIACTFSA